MPADPGLRDCGAGGGACDPLLSHIPRSEALLCCGSWDDPLLESHVKTRDILQEWRVQQRALHAAQERVVERLLCAEMEAVKELQRWRDAGSRTPSVLASSPRGGAVPGDPWRWSVQGEGHEEGETARLLNLGAGASAKDAKKSFAAPQRASRALHGERDHVDDITLTPLNGVSAGDGLTREGGPSAPKTATTVADRMEDVMEKFEKHEEKMDFWRKTSGLHTVDRWALNYNNHPGAWGALLMIHGAAELTGRLRTKVENYAIYSALFLSMSVALLAAPADHMVEKCEGEDFEYWECQVQKHCYVWGLAAGTASHMLCIALAMSFVNALNETARDADVYRMLSRGQGFQATLKCQYAFGVGCLADYVAVAMTLTTYGISWYEPLVIIPIIVTVCGVIFNKTSTLLFNSGSIVNYWRKDKGGNPDPDDPYVLDMPSACFYEKATLNQEVWSPDCDPVQERCRSLLPQNV